MSIVLTVVNAFGDYPRGAQISDMTKVAEILASDSAANCVKSEVEDAPVHIEAPDAPAPSVASEPSAG